MSDQNNEIAEGFGAEAEAEADNYWHNEFEKCHAELEKAEKERDQYKDLLNTFQRMLGEEKAESERWHKEYQRAESENLDGIIKRKEDLNKPPQDREYCCGCSLPAETATLKRQRDELRDAIVKYKWVVENASDGTGGAMNMISARRDLDKVLDSLGSGE